jgi:hypothetical protein
MSGLLSNPSSQALLGSANNLRGMINTVTLGTAFVLSIMVINNYRQCEAGKGYPTSAPMVHWSYYLSIIVLIVACLLFGLDIFNMVMKKRM